MYLSFLCVCSEAHHRAIHYSFTHPSPIMNHDNITWFLKVLTKWYSVFPRANPGQASELSLKTQPVIREREQERPTASRRSKWWRLSQDSQVGHGVCSDRWRQKTGLLQTTRLEYLFNSAWCWIICSPMSFLGTCHQLMLVPIDVHELGQGRPWQEELNHFTFPKCKSSKSS